MVTNYFVKRYVYMEKREQKEKTDNIELDSGLALPGSIVS